MRGIATLWRGTAFDCPLDDSEIILRHTQFTTNREIGICNNGNLVGRSIGVANDCYIAQLNVTVIESFNDKTVQCDFTSTAGTRTIGESLLHVASGMCVKNGSLIIKLLFFYIINLIFTLLISQRIFLTSQQQIVIHLLTMSTSLMPSQEHWCSTGLLSFQTVL